MSRDPIGEKGGLLLYGFVGNSPASAHDYLGAISLADLWNAAGDFIGSVFLLPSAVLSEAEEQAEAGELSAFGVEGGIVWVVGSGEVLGAALMFFPKSCEFAAFDYVAGPLGTDTMEEAKTRIGGLAGMSVGFSVGASVTFVRGWPRTDGPQDAATWLEWFDTVSAGVAPIGPGGAVFWSDEWWGFGIGASAGIGIAEGHIAYYSWYGSDDRPKRWQVRPKCLCNAFRYASMSMPEAMSSILEALKDTL